MVRPEAVRMAGNEVIRHFQTIDLLQIFPILSVFVIMYSLEIFRWPTEHCSRF